MNFILVLSLHSTESALLRVLNDILVSTDAGDSMVLKSTYHGFLKMTVHVVWTIALREWKHPAKI